MSENSLSMKFVYLSVFKVTDDRWMLFREFITPRLHV